MSIGLKGINSNVAQTTDQTSRHQDEGIKITVLRQTDGKGMDADLESQQDKHNVRLLFTV